ncbi:aldehyde dehydrogenase family protein [Methylobacterium soli]|uniref:Aldehyde dehydrogenase family protein n=1 Tax=Methylobacterium soli TaxID=553447 RepID=A0A6L3T173_9HYPH|nr:aldehyde dehydrogenase family protein [Methylobacterium soli]KAB1080285.1 aldehyde dehydrogenase family protein [Methylobacterium soli]GJE44741.1 Gamma-aminobutyraldehyde dehydrogenase [Methylobacterium soli]
MSPYKMLIDGQLVDGDGEIDVIDPARAAPFATAPRASERQLDEAVAAAKRAFSAWSARPLRERQILLGELADRLEAQTDHFARLLTAEQGKPLPQAMFEVAATVRGIRFGANLSLDGERRTHAGGTFDLQRKPLGVVACIMPWNFPMVLASNKYAPALLAGNTVILKPAPTTPLTSLELGRIARDVFPAGVVNVITDDNDLGPLLTRHPDIAKVSFTGSIAAGKQVMRSAADTVKRVTLELGGNDPALVLADADLDRSIAGLVGTAFLNAGQICVAPKRIYVAARIYDAFCERFASAAARLRMGAGSQEGVELGPLQNRRQFERVRAIIADAETRGVILTGGRTTERAGYFIEPTVVRDIAEGSALVDEEQFGPVVPLIRFDEEREAVARANHGAFGLGASVWSRDLDRARALAWTLEAGTVWINQHLALGPDIPLAGAKQSGLGVEAGTEGLWEFTRLQVLHAA